MTSFCAKRPHATCSPPTCKWAQGSKRSFCRSNKNKVGSPSASVRSSPKGSQRASVRGQSSCVNLAATQCNLPACKWANGGKRKFCRSAQNVRRTPGSNRSKSSTSSKRPGPVAKHLRVGKSLARKSSPSNRQKRTIESNATPTAMAIPNPVRNPDLPLAYAHPLSTPSAMAIPYPVRNPDLPLAYAHPLATPSATAAGPPGSVIGNLPAEFIEALDRRRR